MDTRIPDKSIEGYLRALNGFFPYGKWRVVSARKDHEDDFGNPIKRKEEYFARDISAEFVSNVKLSRRSMQLFLSILFIDSVDLYEAGEEKVEEQFRKLPRL